MKNTIFKILVASLMLCTSSLTKGQEDMGRDTLIPLSDISDTTDLTTSLDEQLNFAYNVQNQSIVSTAITRIIPEDFNQGPISDPALLMQGKVPGLQVYNRGGDPNESALIRLRDLSTIGVNAAPLIVIDGVVGASLEGLDPNDISSIDVLRDGTASAIYGIRGSSGVILITTKYGIENNGKLNLRYSGQYGVSSHNSGISILSPDEFRSAGGIDFANSTDWISEITNGGAFNNHGLSASGGLGNTSYYISGNYRKVDGILKNTGFETFNARLNTKTKALSDKLSFRLSASISDRNAKHGFQEAFRYATIVNPTAPIRAVDSPLEFDKEQFGGYFETLGLFDSFNPVSIIEQNRDDNSRSITSLNGAATYSFFENLSGTITVAKQTISNNRVGYYSPTSFFRGNAASNSNKGLAELIYQTSDFILYEGFTTLQTDLSSTSSLKIITGYSFQEFENIGESFFISDFISSGFDFSTAKQLSNDLSNGALSSTSSAQEGEKVISFFSRANAVFNENLFVNASLRYENSSQLGPETPWSIFPSIGIAADFKNIFEIKALDLFNVRAGYSITGSLPGESGFSSRIARIITNPDGTTTVIEGQDNNVPLNAEKSKEFNLGVDVRTGGLSVGIDFYERKVTDLIRLIELGLPGASKQFVNSGSLSSTGLEIVVDWDVVNTSNTKYNTGVAFSTYSTQLSENSPEFTRIAGNLGSPGNGQNSLYRIQEGVPVGQMWGPVFKGIDEDGRPLFEDVNNDGVVNANVSQALEEGADFVDLGNGLPDFELGLQQNITLGSWSLHAFFRGAFGHSLINSLRAFYEPRNPTFSSYGYVETSKAVDGLTSSRYSSLYVEKADFVKLDYLTLSKRISLGENSPLQNLKVSLTGQNLFTITGYTGADPEPALIDYGPSANGGIVNTQNGNVLTPGIDRRNYYLPSRSVTLGVGFDF